MIPAISSEHVKNICKLGQMADCCRYLACGSKGFECLKGTNLQALLDKRAAEKTMHAQSDNCAGWDKLKMWEASL